MVRKKWNTETPKVKLFVEKSIETSGSCRSNLSLARWVCATYFLRECAKKKKERNTNLLMCFGYEPVTDLINVLL